MTDRVAAQAIAHRHSVCDARLADPPPAGTRGENSRLGPDAGDSSTQSSPETSGGSKKNSGRKISGSEPWGGCW